MTKYTRVTLFQVLLSPTGMCSAELNREVAQKFAEVAGYAHLDTASIIEECIGKPILEVEQEEGRDTVVVAEASVIEQTALQLRSSISMLGGGWGAAARFDISRPSCCGCFQPSPFPVSPHLVRGAM